MNDQHLKNTLLQELALVELADEVLRRMLGILHQMYDLAYLATDPARSQAERQALDAQFQLLVDELENTASCMPDLSRLQLCMQNDAFAAEAARLYEQKEQIEHSVGALSLAYEARQLH